MRTLDRAAGCAAVGLLAVTAACSTGTSPTGTVTAPAQAAPADSAPLPTTAARDLVDPATPTRDLLTDLDVPWSAVVLPDGAVVLSERDTGRIVRLAPDGSRSVLGTVPDVDPDGEGGLLGLAVAPDVGSTRELYAYVTSSADNRVVVLTLAPDGTLAGQRPILTGIPKASNHDGGRIAFGPDGYLYVTTGDAGRPDAAQDPASLSGKILRVTSDGAPAPGNPTVGSPVWSLGHRNVEGLAWDAEGRLWASEFGLHTWDELNAIVPGGNYGWPVVEGAARRPGFIDPVRQWAPADASPSGLTVGPDGALYMAALRGSRSGGSRWPAARPVSRNGCCRTASAGCGTCSSARTGGCGS